MSRRTGARATKGSGKDAPPKDNERARAPLRRLPKTDHQHAGAAPSPVEPAKAGAELLVGARTGEIPRTQARRQFTKGL